AGSGDASGRPHGSPHQFPDEFPAERPVDLELDDGARTLAGTDGLLDAGVRHHRVDDARRSRYRGRRGRGHGRGGIPFGLLNACIAEADLTLDSAVGSEYSPGWSIHPRGAFSDAIPFGLPLSAPGGPALWAIDPRHHLRAA